jgi:hypothetical protein
MPDSEIFFAYPSQPNLLREAVAAAADRVGGVGGVKARRWEDLRVSGRVVIDEIFGALDRADASVFEVTDLNANVLFELGYAVGRSKRVLPVLNGSVADAAKRYKETRILDGVGYSTYEGSEGIFSAFMRERPDLRESSIFEESIEPALHPAGLPSLFYVTSIYGDDASTALKRVVRNATSTGIRLSMADPRETSVQPLTWYAQQIFDAAAVLLHFESPRKLNSDLHNARCSFIGGLVRGMDASLLMLAPEDYSSPFDYRDLLFVYGSASECATRAEYWLNRELEPARLYLASVASEESRRRLSTELRTLRLGEPVAENEAQMLDEYFVETSVYQQVLDAHTGVFVGRRGSGKTATMLEAARALAADRRVLVCTITPSDYQMGALARLVRGYREGDTRGFVIEAIWRFLVYTEIALAVVRDIGVRPAGLQPNAPEWELSLYFEGPGADLKADFDIRLERAVQRLGALRPSATVEEERANVTEALYNHELVEIRRLLESALRERDRVALLIDNLDRAWDQKGDLGPLSYVLLGLLTSVPQIATELQRGGGGYEPIPLTAAIFIRSDIYSQLVRTAVEPDKIPVRRVQWDDSILLVQVINERYSASVGNGAPEDELWTKFFCTEVQGLDVRDYILKRVLPRPRDIIVHVTAAIEAAVVRRSPVVDVEHVLMADQVYSQFAYDAIKIEDPSMGERLELAMIEFAGGVPVLTSHEVEKLLKTAGLTPEEFEEAISQLRDVSFLGVEVQDGVFDYSDDVQAKRRADVMARRLATREGRPVRYEVHPAFRPYLEVQDLAPSGTS